MRLRILGLLALVMIALGVWAAEPTVFTISNDVVRPAVKRMGMNLGGDAWYSGAIIMKERIPHGSFEGSIFRTIEWGPGGDEKTLYLPFGSGTWDPIYQGAKYTIVTGPGMGHTGTVKAMVPNQLFPAGGDPTKKYMKMELDGLGPMKPYGNTVVIFEKELETGYLGQHGGSFWVHSTGDARVTTEKGDVRPGSKGKIAAVISAPDKATVTLVAPLGNDLGMNMNGSWRLRFWAKGDAKLTLGFGTWKPSAGEPTKFAQPLTLTPEWQQHEIVFAVKDYPYQALCLQMIATEGKVKLDEVSMQQDGDTNPTAFRDSLITTLNKYRPGSLRLLQMGGSSLENFLRPSESRLPYAPARNSNPLTTNVWPSHPNQPSGNVDIYEYGMHEFLELCKEVDADPWVCIPGTATPQDMNDLMEYLNGPANTPFGKIRADRGQVKPWTEVFDNIHIEFGNEAWNWSGAYNHRGYNGPDYWRTLMGFAKMARHYSPKVKFQVGGQASYVGLNANIVTDKWNGDGFTVAPYIIHEMSAAQAKQTNEEIWSWVFGYPWYNATQGYMAQNYKAITKPYGLELSIYEVNHHITGGDAPAAARDKIVAGVGGGLNVANWMMMMLERQNVRVQNLFSLLQFNYNYGGGNVRLWGTALSMKPGGERYRPTFQAVSLLNEVLEGDLVKITKAGVDPKWSCTSDYGSKNKPFDVPYLQGYATREEEKRGFILFNLHRTEALPVTLNFTGGVAPGSVTQWTLAGDRIDANNEPGHPEEVKIVEEKLTNFASGTTLTIKPFSMVVIRWEEPRDKSVAQFTTTQNPSGPWSYLATAYGTGQNGMFGGFDFVNSPVVKMTYDAGLKAWKSPSSNAQITANGVMYHSGQAGKPTQQTAPVLRYTYTGKDNTINVKLIYRTLGRDARDLFIYQNGQRLQIISATEDAIVTGSHLAGSPESGIRLSTGAPYDAQIKEVVTYLDVAVKDGDTLDFTYTGLWDPRWEIPQLQVVVDKRQ